MSEKLYSKDSERRTWLDRLLIFLWEGTDAGWIRSGDAQHSECSTLERSNDGE